MKKIRRKNMLELTKKKLTKAEIKEAIIELNYYMLTAIDIHDETSVREIRDEMTELVNIYLNGNDE